MTLRESADCIRLRREIRRLQRDLAAAEAKQEKDRQRLSRRKALPENIDEMVLKACQVCGVPTSIFNRNGFGEFYRGQDAIDRRRVWHWMRVHMGLSYPNIARATTGRGHVTIMEAVKAFDASECPACRTQ